ncbi:MAG: signal peptidase I [Anaerolineales bacterium]|nr:signal peptidase I [Anaerolineales bacterium]
MVKRLSSNLASGIWLIVMIGLWLAFAPTQAGGLASYILVVGNSMEPNFHIGDLVIVHEEAEYQVGDAVVYSNLELGNFVFHRIIAQKLGRFTLQGDHNSWVDTYQPSKEEVRGKLWLHIPKGGRAVEKIRNPYIMAGIAGILGGVLASGFFKSKSKGRKSMNRDWLLTLKQKLRELPAKLGDAQLPNSSLEPHLEALTFGLGCIAFASLLIGLVAFSRPATRTVKNEVGYEQLGSFIYTASASASVYDANTLQSGDPIFPKLTCIVDMQFQYLLIAQQAEKITGTIQLTATVAEPVSGWQRVVELQKEMAFSGSSVSANAKLDLCKIEKLTQALEQDAEVHPGSYTLTVSPNIKVKGRIADHELDSAFNPGLEFRYDRQQFYLVNEEEEDKEVNLLHTVETGALSAPQLEANTIKVFNLEFAVPALRLIAILGLIVSLSGLAFLGKRLRTISQNDPVQLNRIRFGSIAINVQNAKALDSKSALDVSSIDDLSKLAEKFNAPLLHAERNQTHVYYVQGEGTTYRFTLSVREAEPQFSETESGDKA